MKPALLSIALLVVSACPVAAATDDTTSDTMAAWVESCESDRSQHGATACAIAESARAQAALDAVEAEVRELYAAAGEDHDGRSAALQRVQASWKAQVQADIDALFPLAPGEAPSVTYGSSYVMQMEMVRALAQRQRAGFLCNTWLPEHNRRSRMADDVPSACAPASTPD